eukprot:3239105-Pleurochrysis_carterae.AAC.1
MPFKVILNAAGTQKRKTYCNNIEPEPADRPMSRTYSRRASCNQSGCTFLLTHCATLARGLAC